MADVPRITQSLVGYLKISSDVIASVSTRATNDTTWFRAGMAPILQYLSSVDKDVTHANRILV